MFEPFPVLWSMVSFLAVLLSSPPVERVLWPFLRCFDLFPAFDIVRLDTPGALMLPAVGSIVGLVDAVEGCVSPF